MWLLLWCNSNSSIILSSLVLKGCYFNQISTILSYSSCFNYLGWYLWVGVFSCLQYSDYSCHGKVFITTEDDRFRLASHHMHLLWEWVCTSKTCTCNWSLQFRPMWWINWQKTLPSHLSPMRRSVLGYWLILEYNQSQHQQLCWASLIRTYDISSLCSLNIFLLVLFFSTNWLKLFNSAIGTAYTGSDVQLHIIVKCHWLGPLCYGT
jgi:hypothetical protein